MQKDILNIKDDFTLDFSIFLNFIIKMLSNTLDISYFCENWRFLLHLECKILDKAKLTIFWGSPLWWPFTFASRGRHSWLLPKATTSLKSEKPIFAAGGSHIYLWPEATRLSKSHVPTEIGMYGHYILSKEIWKTPTLSRYLI